MLPSGNLPFNENSRQNNSNYFEENNNGNGSNDNEYLETKPFIIADSQKNGYNVQAEVVDENLNMMEHEKRLIIQALKKHNNRRREASEDLGISERTLYRKIKEYSLE